MEILECKGAITNEKVSELSLKARSDRRGDLKTDQ